MPAYVYLLCFERPLPSGNRPRHYVGSTGDLGERQRHHARHCPHCRQRTAKGQKEAA